MHLKVLLTAGAATASLIAGTAGTALLGHAAAAPQHKVVQPAPHHLSATNHAAGTKGKKGTVTHKNGATNKGNVKGSAKPKPKPKTTPKPTPKPTPAPVSPAPTPHA
ncbi:MAG TPA: hypothetical protein VGL20_15750 [Candidatus Dormibacteraeota bacterium]|jgi:hypothetical protein